MNPFTIIMFILIPLAIGTIALAVRSGNAKSERKKLNESISRLEKENSSLKLQLENMNLDIKSIPQVKAGEEEHLFQDLEKEFYAKLNKAEQAYQEAVHKNAELYHKIERISTRAETYQQMQEELKELLMQCEEAKTEFNNTVSMSKREMYDEYLNIQEKMSKYYDFSEELEPNKNQIGKSVKIQSSRKVIALMNAIDNMSETLKNNKEAGIRFEKIIVKIMDSNGFTNIQLTQNSNDNGIDIFAERNGLTYAIQCKCYKSDIGKHAVQEVSSGNNLYKKDRAIAVTNRHFSSYAREFAEAVNVELWDREKLLKMMHELREHELEECIRICQASDTRAEDNMPHFEDVPVEYKSALKVAKRLMGDFGRSKADAFESMQNDYHFTYSVAKFAVDNIDRYYYDIN